MVLSVTPETLQQAEAHAGFRLVLRLRVVRRHRSLSPYLVATLTTATTMIITSDNGMSTSHENRCSWSSRSLG